MSSMPFSSSTSGANETTWDFEEVEEDASCSVGERRKARTRSSRDAR